MQIRNVGPDDYAPIVQVLDQWWGGRHMTDMLPKLFFVHFCKTSFIAEVNGRIVGFLIGFLSQSQPEDAYIHFVGVHPDFRKQGIGSTLHKTFFQTVQNMGRCRIRCVTSPANKESIAYHLRIGFVAQPSDAQFNGVPYYPNYDGAGEHRVVFTKQL